MKPHCLQRAVAVALALAVAQAGAQTPPCAAADAEAAQALLVQAQAWRDAAGRLACHEVANASVLAPAPGAPPVPRSSRWQWHPALHAIALEQARSLAQRQVLEHFDAQGRGLAARAGERAYDFRLLAENLGRGADTVPAMFSSWAGSEQHCVHLANTRYIDAALACATGADGTYWVMVFGRR